MRFTLFSVALRNLKRKSFRTAVLVFSIGLLVSILVFGTSFIVSVSSSIERATNRLGADVLIVPPGARDFAQEALLETSAKSFYMDRSFVERVKNIKGVESVTYHIYLTSVLGICCDIPAAKIVAFNQDTDFILKPWLTNVLKRRLNKGEAIIGPVAEENFGLLDVTSSVLFNTKFKFVGRLDKTGTGLDNAIFIAEENIPDILNRADIGIGNDQISLIFVKLERGLDPNAMGKKIEAELLNVEVINRNDMGSEIVGVLRDINKVFMLTIILSIVLAVFLSWSVFSAIANERTREIGVMRAIGAKGSHVIGMFAAEVLVLGLLGSLVGIVAGTIMSISLNNLFLLLKELSVSMSIAQRVGVGLFGLFVGTAVCSIGAYSSIMRLKNLEPLSALKEQ